MSRVWVLLSALCFGTTGTAQALGPDATTPATVGAARVLFGALLLGGAAAWLGRGGRRDRPAARRASLTHAGRAPLLAAGVAVAGYQLCFFAAVDRTGVAVGTVVALGSAPAIAGLGGRLVDGTPLTRAWALATALGAAGVALLALGGGGAGTEIDAGGVALAVGAGASYAAFTLATKRLLAAGTRDAVVMAAAFGLGAVLLLPVLVAGDSGWLFTPGGLALALWLGAVPTAAGYLLFARGLRRLTAGETATLTLAEPATATLLGAVVLGETLDAAAVGGIALIAAGLAVLAAQPASSRPQVVPEPV
jgi:drug/metabolite transporter, DME family